ncbi:uncharacterized protein LOC134789909 [Cydia splendana]|uniref:uncharacterized protein LOC134789909 n=1 Tax=Cydia splendana TaxID=1100963 RepID=UPI00300C7750
MERFRMKTCGNISFVPEDFVFDVRMSVNNRTVLRRRVSADNPPPICFNPGRAPFVRICAEISNIRIRNNNAFACLDITADIAGFQIYSASFRCFGLGTKGLQTGLNPKPVSSGPAPVSLFGNNDDDDDRDGFLSNVAGGIFGGGDEGGLFGGGGGGGIFGGGSDNDDDDGGPLDDIGDAVGDLFDGRVQICRRIEAWIITSRTARAASRRKLSAMENLIVCLVSIALFLSPAYGNVTVEEKTNLTRTALHFQDLKDLEVPDSALIFLERLKSKSMKELSLRARQSPEVQNATSTSEEEDDEPSRRCTCSFGVCKCCTGLVLDLFNQKACMKITYHPGDFAFDVAMSMNDRVLYENSMSGKNPKPICINPPRLRNLKVCAKFYNVFFPGRNFHFCLAMTGQWRQLELFNMAFDCLRMGANGLAMVKPEENGGLVIPNPGGGVDAVVDSGDDDIEEYDENNVKSLFDFFDDDDRK